ncbi:heme-dependent oxidative N-demethylase family protein [Celeribacter sp. SCSIO 80788]|uniref:heme-dependent oxidative N-demethylase family protein n=1 Tax=Celeribacter sp. SCSIO 80788 TaxID=3117013 RepID=UPI003DA2DB85
MPRKPAQHLAMDPILQTKLSFAPWADPRTARLPGVIPFELSDWLEVDTAYGGQMALRDHLILTRPEEVVALDESARPAALELFDMLLGMLPGLGFVLSEAEVTRPDGVTVPLDRDHPMQTMGRLLQCDICLMQPDPTGETDESVLTGGVLCFPSGWRLPQKFMKPMLRIHKPIEVYTPDLAMRVQRMMNGVQVGRGLMRGTASRSDAHLCDPRSEGELRHGTNTSKYIRVERQSLVRLPETRAVVFTIHTQVVLPEALSPEQAAALDERPIRLAD